MTTPSPMPSDTPSGTPTSPTPPQEGQSRWTVQRIIIGAVIGLVGLIVLIVVIAIILALASPDTFGPIFEVFRDLVVIVLAIEGILIVISFAVLVAQIARLVNLLQNEVKPVLENAQETVNTTSSTARFLSDIVLRPVILASSYLAAIRVIIRDLGGIRRAINPEAPKETPESKR